MAGAGPIWVIRKMCAACHLMRARLVLNSGTEHAPNPVLVVRVCALHLAGPESGPIAFVRLPDVVALHQPARPALPRAPRAVDMRPRTFAAASKSYCAKSATNWRLGV